MHLGRFWRLLALIGAGLLVPALSAVAETTRSAVLTPDPGPYGPNRYLFIAAVFSGPVSVTGLPTLGFTAGGSSRAARLDHVESANKLIFSYVTRSGDNGVLKINSQIDLNGGRIQDASGADVVVTFASPDTSSIFFDTTPPVAPTIDWSLPSSTPSFGGTAEPGAGVEVHESGGGNHYGGQVTAAADGTWRTGWIMAPLPAGTYSFYAVAYDHAGNASPISAPTTIVVPAAPDTGTGGTGGDGPNIASATVPGSGGFVNGTVELTVRFDAPVYVTGMPQILLTLSGARRYAQYIAGTGTTDLVFRYALQRYSDSGQVYWGDVIELNGGTIRDKAGHDAHLHFTAPTTPVIYADAVPPAPPVITAITQTATPTLTGTSEPYSRVFITIAGMGGAAVATLGAGGNEWRYDWSDRPIPAGTYGVRVTAADQAGNLSDQSNTVVLTVPPAEEPGGRDVTPPKTTGWKPGVVEGSAPNVVKFWLGFTEPVTGFDAADVLIGVTGDARATAGSPQPDGSGTAYIIPVTFSGHGTIKVSVPGGAEANIRDLAGNLYANGQDSYVMFTLPTPQAPVITSPLRVDATVGVSFTYTIVATGSPTSYGASTTATWLTFDRATHTLSGTPPKSEVVGVSLAATNDAGIGNAGLTIDVHTTDGVSGGVSQRPVVHDATVNGHVGVPIVPVQLSSDGNPTLFNAPDLASYGLAVDRYGLITGTPTAAANGVVVSVVAANPTGNSDPAKITLNIVGGNAQSGDGGGNGNGTGNGNANGSGNGNGGGNTNNIPVLTDAVVSGQVGLTLKPVQVMATNSPTLFSAPGLALYGLAIDHSGMITGIATASANGFTVRVTASNPYGTSAAANITLNIAPAAANSSGTSGVKIESDQKVDLGASASAAPVTYTVVSGPGSVVNDQLVFTGSGTVVVKATQATSTQRPGDATLTFSAVPVDRLVNLSSRMHVDGSAGAPASIVGFVVTGTTPKTMLVRAVGPSLSAFGVGDAAPDPHLRLFDSSGAVVAENSGWANNAQISAAGDAVGAFKLAANSTDAAVLATLSPGAYTVLVSTGASGTVLVEVYDVGANADVPTKQLVNISARGAVEGTDKPLVGGFVVSGGQTKRVLIRGVGPTLAAFGVTGVLTDPVLRVYDAAGKVIAENDNWQTGTTTDIAAASASAGAFALQAGSADAALVLALESGQYSAVVTGAAGAKGAAMVEVYELP